MLSKRRGQAKKAIIDMVQLCITAFVDNMPTREERYNLLTTLREATDGKLFLEKEYANCTRMLCEMHEEDGRVDEATKIIQEIQIETYGSLINREKVDFILYQMKLVLMRQDFVRLQIMSRKISKKAIAEVGLESQKIEYFNFMTKYFIHEKIILDVAKSFHTIFETFAKNEAALDPTGANKNLAFQNFAFFLMLAPYSNEKVDLMNIVEKNNARELDQNEIIAKFLKKFLTFELYPFNEAEVEQSVQTYQPFHQTTENYMNHMQEFLR